MLRRRRAIVLLGSVAVLLAACGTSPGPAVSGAIATAAAASSPPTPIAEPVPSGPAMQWAAASIEQSPAVTAAVSAPPAFCSPCHGINASSLLAVDATPVGLIAVGVQGPPARAAIWRSTSDTDWARVTGLPVSDGTLGLAVAGGDGRAVVVGVDPAGAAAWATEDGVTWARAPGSPSLAGPLGGTRMTSVVAWRDGFVAGGWADDPATGRVASAIWTSADGLAWDRVSLAPAVAAGHLLGLAATPDTLVAVGAARGDGDGPAVVWVSHDALNWERVASPTFAAGGMRAVTVGPVGFVAVGANIADDGALAWVSPDGTTWTSVPDAVSLHAYGLPIRMLSVTPVGDALVAVGWKSDAGNGSGVAWASRDGLDWLRAPEAPTLFGAEMAGVTATATVIVGVGTLGYPDNDAAAVWLSGR